MSHINFICEIAHAYQHMPAYFHYITQNHAYLPTHKNMSPDDGTVATPHERPPLLRGHFHTTFRVAAGEGFYCIMKRTFYQYDCHEWNIKMDLVSFLYLQFWESHIHNKVFWSLILQVCLSHMTAGVRGWDLNTGFKLPSSVWFLDGYMSFSSQAIIWWKLKIHTQFPQQGTQQCAGILQVGLRLCCICQWNLVGKWCPVGGS